MSGQDAMTGLGHEPRTNGLTFRPSIDITTLLLLELHPSVFLLVAFWVACGLEIGIGSVPVITDASGRSETVERLGSIDAAVSRSTARGRVYRPVISILE